MSRLIVPVMLAAALPASAGGLEDFTARLNAQARADLSAFSAQVAVQFRVGEAQVRAVLGSVREPADAFLLFQLGQWSGRPVEQVLPVYRARRGRGWGEVAKELGIKPGSHEFHALKQGRLRFGERGPGEAPGKGKGKGKGRWKQEP